METDGKVIQHSHLSQQVYSCLFLCRLSTSGFFPDSGLAAAEEAEEAEDGASIHKNKVISEFDEFEPPEGRLEGGKGSSGIEGALSNKNAGKQRACPEEDEDAVREKGQDQAERAGCPAEDAV